MRKWFNIPLYYLVVAAGLGLLLRWSLIAPVEGFTYGFWLHAHSHVMFLGWVFNFFNLAFLYNAFGKEWRRPYRTLFLLNQLLIIGMLILFPMQGYGSVTIPLSIIHTVVSAIFCIRFIRDTRDQRSNVSRRFAVWSLILFLVSSIGPFALGPIMMQGLGHSQWYFFAIYFYLHFQYNGVFVFGLLSIFSHRISSEATSAMVAPLRKAGLLLFIAVFPTYALSLLWADVPAILNWIGFFGAVMQIAAVVILWRGFSGAGKLASSKTSRLIVSVVIASFLLKIALQTVSALPVIARLAYENKYYVIAYLHLVLIGVISLAILTWYIGEWSLSPRTVWVLALIAGFVLSEFVMVMVPLVEVVAQYSSMILLAVSLLLFIGFTGLSFARTREKLITVMHVILIITCVVSPHIP